MPNELWGMGVAGITVHFRCYLCGEEIAVRQDFHTAFPVIYCLPGPAEWLNMNKHWYCSNHTDGEMMEEMEKSREMSHA